MKHAVWARPCFFTNLDGNLGIENASVRDNVFVECCSGGQCGANGTTPVFNPAHSTGVVLTNNTWT